MYLSPRSPADLAAAVAALPRPDGAPVLLLVGEAEAPDLGDLVAALDDAGVVVGGGVFPGLLTAEGHREAGAVALALPGAAPPVVIPGLDTGDVGGVEALDLPEGGTAAVFVDGLAAHVGGFLAALFHHAGASVTYVGGGAGSLSLEQAPCLFSNAGVVQDAALVVATPAPSRVGVRHGWTRLAGPLVATETAGTRVAALNWEPALDVYRRHVEPVAGRAVTADDFFSVSKAFPFGIAREGREDVVRDPIAVEGEALVCVGEVPPNSALHVLRGDAAALVAAAAQAAADVTDGAAGGVGLVADCISRVLFLEDRFDEEWDAVCGAFETAGLGPPEGALTLGEIASDGRGFLQLYNKTCVAALVDASR